MKNNIPTLKGAMRGRIAGRLLTALIAFFMLSALPSCVHEWPEAPETRPAYVTVKHQLPWKLFDFNLPTKGRGDSGKELEVRYIFEVYVAGTSEVPVKRIEMRRADTSLADFTVALDLPEGKYDVWVWSDFVAKDENEGLFYNASKFSQISYMTPYVGDTTEKDAFRGMFSIDVPHSLDENVSQNYEVTLERPLTAYAFISIDLREFVRNEIIRRGLPGYYDPNDSHNSGVPEIPADAPLHFDFSKYKAVITYTGYLPSVYNIFRDRPVDSATGVQFEGNLQLLNSQDILIGFDYFFINGKESNISIAIEIFDPDGVRVSFTPGLLIPVERSRATIVRGEYLTSKASGGVGIKTEFDGSFNIQL